MHMHARDVTVVSKESSILQGLACQTALVVMHDINPPSIAESICLQAELMVNHCKEQTEMGQIASTRSAQPGSP